MRMLCIWKISAGTWEDGVEELNAMLEPGMLVRHPNRPDWGLGQVQSNIGWRVTVNFEHIGKTVIDGRRVMLTPEYDP